MRTRGFMGWSLFAMLGLGVVLALPACQNRGAKEPAQPNAAEDSIKNAEIQRGHQAFLANCAMCHGAWGEGNGPMAADLVRSAGVAPANLNDSAKLANMSRDELIDIITRGGGETHRSNLMPPWGDKLKPGVIGELADFVMALPTLKPGIPRASIERYLEAPPGTSAEGRKLFAFYCTACHGPDGKGDGYVADTLWVRNGVRPRNLTDSTYFAQKTDQEIYVTVELGGAFTGHSAYMPGWKAHFDPAQIRDLVAYVRALSHTPSRP